MRQTCRGGHSTQSSQLGQCYTREDTIPGRRDFRSGASEQRVLNSSHLLQASPKELQTQTMEKVPNSLHPFKISRKTHTLPNTSQNVISQDYIFSGFFSPGLFLEDFVIHSAKNNPSGKGVVWLSEKAAHCPSKLCYQCL